MLNVVLHEPEIVLNTGSIVRTCLAVNAKLHLIKPLGFDVSTNSLKRYSANNFIKLKPLIYENWDDFIKQNKDGRKFFLTSKWGANPSECNLDHKKDNLYLIFGKESKGLPQQLLKANKKWCMRLPMSKEIKCLNLSNTVAIIAYEAKRQSDFFDVK